MAAITSPLGAYGPARTGASGLPSERRTIGRAAGIVITCASSAGLAAVMLGDSHVQPAFYVLVALAICGGIACIHFPWERHSTNWLHALAVIATVSTAIGIRLAGVYGDVAADYYVFVGVFASYAFSSRKAVAAHVALASCAAALPLLYAHPTDPEAPPRTVVSVALIVLISGIVMLLREGLHKRQRELEELAARDPLTGVGNYRLLSDRLQYEVTRHKRSGGSFTVMLLDLDGFKEINDTLGHLAGDRALCEIASALASSVRAQDTVARQGGDEFSILAPGTNDEQAEGLARRAQAAVHEAMAGSVTTSVGWVTFPNHGSDPAQLLALADEQLRRAKHERGAERSGRGFVHTAQVSGDGSVGSTQEMLSEV
jgi:diguanylate cyclase (GGDEF)-like protein